jgi:hypothetical protein
MVRHNSWLAGAVMVVLVVGTAIGQDQPRRPGAGFGFGGRGGGGGVQLLAMEEVQKELLLNEDQVRKVKETLDGLRQGAGNFNFRDLQDLSQEERQKKMEEMQAKMAEATKKATDEVNKVLDEKQKARFAELQLQREGINAIVRKDVAEKLGLSKEQTDKIAKLQEESRTAQRPAGNFQDLSQEERQELFTKAQKAREKLTADMEGVLTADQKATWTKMLGAKFEFPAPRGFGGAGGRPGNRPEGAGGGRPGARPEGAGARPGGAGGERRRPAGKTEDKKAEDKKAEDKKAEDK